MLFIESYFLYIRLIIQHIMILSSAQRNLTIYLSYKCSTYIILMSKITIVSGHMIRTV